MNLLLKYDANMNLHYFVLPPAPQLPEHNMYWYLPLLEMYPWSFSWNISGGVMLTLPEALELQELSLEAAIAGESHGYSE